MNINKLFDLLIKCYHSNDYLQAERICKKILQEKPNDVDALHFLGMIYSQIGHNDIAIDYIKRALKFDPNFADAYNNLGNIYQEKF